MKNILFGFMLIFGFSSSISAQNNVSDFRKNYGKEIYYHYSGDFNYTQAFLDELYLIAEYYIANSKNELLKSIIDNKDRLEYSVEQQQRDGKKYTVLGIGTVTEGRITKAQWLFTMPKIKFCTNTICLMTNWWFLSKKHLLVLLIYKITT